MVLLDGKRVASVAEHPTFRPVVDTVAGLLARHVDSEDSDLLLATEPDGRKVPRYAQLPRSADDLVRLGEVSEWWASQTLGQMSRLPDYAAAVVRGLWSRRAAIAATRPQARHTIEALYQRMLGGAVVDTIAFADPPVGRDLPFEEQDLLRVVRSDAAGVVLSGAKTLCTGAPYADEILVLTFPSSLGPLDRRPKDQLVGVVVSPSTPGLSILCRQPMGGIPSLQGLDEIDAALIFEDVLVPPERVLFAGEVETAKLCFQSVSTFDTQAFTRRLAVKYQALFGLGWLMAEALGVRSMPAAWQALADLGRHEALVRQLLRAAELQPAPAPDGEGVVVDPLAVHLALQYAIRHHADALRSLELLGGQGLLLVPSEGDLASPESGPWCDRFLKGPTLAAAPRARLMRLAAELVGSRFASRQRLFEDYALGGLTAVTARLGRLFDPGAGVSLVESFLGEELTH